MRSGIGVFATACMAIVASCPRAAVANECSGNVSPCINDDTLWPHAGPSRFQAIGGSETTATGQLGFALQATYLSRPIVLQLQSPGGGSQAYAVNDQGNATFLFSYGVGQRLELDLALPLTLGQGGTGLAPVTGGAGLSDTAVRDMRFGFTYALARDDHRKQTERSETWGIAARFEVSAPTGDRDQFAGERSGVFVPSVSADARIGRFFGAAEVGARIRPITELLGARVGTQLVGELGAGFDLSADGRLSAALEAWALPTLVGQISSAEVAPTAGAPSMGPSSSGGALVPAEWQLSLRASPLASRELSVQLGGGGALDDSLTTPRVRLTLTVRWAPAVHPAAPATPSPP
jgi:hypothetical protein